MADELTIWAKLSELSQNLWWSWQPECGEIFRDLDPAKWPKTRHNPVVFLRELGADAVATRARDTDLNSRVNQQYRRFREYMTDRDTWGHTHAGVLNFRPAAYFSAEFGLHESLRIYSGGLGVLAGDHLKSASDLGVPLVGIGLFYHEGYFSQYMNAEGWQQETYERVDPQTLPMSPALTPAGDEIRVSVQTRGGEIHARVWTIQVGRVTLYLLDADVPENTAEDRKLTARLYGGDGRTRIRQELMLGVGGVKALTAAGINPRVVHMNEGHSAFASLELIRMRVQNDGLTFDDALREVSAMGHFTTHTPVPAGHDRFDYELVAEHLGPIADAVGLDAGGLMALGRVDPNNHNETFCMTVLAFKTARRANGVSNLHGVVSRRMWKNLWPWKSEAEVPIGHITNGVHVPTWLAPQMRQLYDRHLVEKWYLQSGEARIWADFDRVDPGELFETHQALKVQCINYARRKMAEMYRRHEGELSRPKGRADDYSDVLDPNCLLIGFARRFAPYKRADLFMKDLDRLRKITDSTDRPVHFVFAGKAHPADENGKKIAQNVVRLSQTDEFYGKVLFLEDYDMNLTRHLIQGVDVWLNNPRRPLEASGTSGQKVVLNGGLNFSILDGWWAEAFDGDNGFAIGDGQTHVDQAVQDARDTEAMMQTLEDEVIPLYYDRDADGLPQEWIFRMKWAIRTLGWRFNADRMVMDYTSECYVPAAQSTSREIVVMP